jgi:hypothetical protein
MRQLSGLKNTWRRKMPEYRADLPSVPTRLRSRPIERGYPVPWFVAEIDGRYDFRVADAEKLGQAVRQNLCWTCGQKLGAYKAFGVGPMCVVNRTSSEPPSHRDCIEWSAQACPFLNQSLSCRREGNLPEAELVEPGGFAILRQPGVTVLYITQNYRVFRAPNNGGLLFTMGEPTEVRWFRQGRAATRAECLEAIETGYPALLEMAEAEGQNAIRELEQRKQAMLALLPQEVPL